MYVLHLLNLIMTNIQFALAAVGRTEGILDYNRIRAGKLTVLVPGFLLMNRYVVYDLLN
jgi:hypothetical protein